MTRIKLLFAVLVVAAIVAVVPAGAAVNVHFVGAGSSAQFLTAAVGADDITLHAPYSAQSYAQCLATPNALPTVFHWTNSNAFVADRRNVNIHNEPGKVWIVWIGPCNSPTAGVTDLWTDISVDSTVGVRVFMAQESAANGGAGAQLNVTGTGTSSLAIAPQGLWPDNSPDFGPVALSDDELTAINSPNSGGGINVTVGLTDIRPEDALFATTRAITAPVDTVKWAKLGYASSVKCVGAAILSAQSGSSADATPICFNLTGLDPLLKSPTHAVRSYTTIPVGAAPIIFATNNNNNLCSGNPCPIVTNLVSKIHTSSNDADENGPFLLAKLYDGSTSCDYSNAAFNPAGPATAITIFLREPLSGTMNTTEFSVFRTEDNANDSQEQLIAQPLGGPPQNPLSWTCGPSHNLLGKRSRSIGTGEVVGKASPAQGLVGTPNSLGYFFFSFANASSLSGASFNYLTLDGIDPLQATTPSGQRLPSCAGPCTAAGLGTDQLGWTLGTSYPHLRDGTYVAWSLYRWVADPNDPHFADVQALAQSAQDHVNTTDADFVPFHTSDNSDGLSVYRAHFLPTGVTLAKLPPGTVVGDGSQTTATAGTGYTTLGGGPEAGGDVGGCILGPFSNASGVVPLPSATVSVTGTGKTVNFLAGDHFVTGDGWEGASVTVNGVADTVSAVTSNIKLTLKTAVALSGSTSFQFNGALACKQ